MGEQRSRVRLATLIISLVLSLGLFFQSCAVAVGGSVSDSLSTTAQDKQEAQDLAGGGAFGVLAALMWLVAAGLVMSKPKASMWIFIAAAVSCLIGGATGFSDLFIWAAISLIFALMSWRGTKERENQEAEKRSRYQADVNAAAAAGAAHHQPPPVPTPPQSPQPPQ